MDIAKKPQKSKLSLKNKLIIGAVALLAFSGYQLMQPSSGQKIDRKELLIGTVQQGEFKIQVDGFGLLRSDKQKLLTSLTNATVEEVVLKPGAMVTPDSVILRLSNPELMLEIERAKQSLSQEKANLRQLKLTNQRNIMGEEAVLAELKADHKATRMRRLAEEKLVKDGIISTITYNTTKVNEELLAERIEIQEKRNKQLVLMQEETIKIQEEQINQEEALFEAISNRVDRLTVKAGLHGVLQSNRVELGQSVVAGQALSLVGSTEDLMALIRVPQTQAQKIRIGQQAVVDTRRDKIDGEVVRINPAVEEGTVTIEVAFKEALPDSARPELNVDGTIFIETLKNVKFIERPVNVSQNNRKTLYKLASDGDTATTTDMVFGAESGRYIQIKSGADKDEKIILSDMTRLDLKDTITITR